MHAVRLRHQKQRCHMRVAQGAFCEGTINTFQEELMSARSVSNKQTPGPRTSRMPQQVIAAPESFRSFVLKGSCRAIRHRAVGNGLCIGMQISEDECGCRAGLPGVNSIPQPAASAEYHHCRMNQDNTPDTPLWGVRCCHTCRAHIHALGPRSLRHCKPPLCLSQQPPL